jgi:Trk K+ transport system NAD-binding subunit
LRDSFYLVCGYGETGGILVRALTDRGQGAVVVDSDRERLDLLHMNIMPQYVPALCGDAGKPENMLKAGLGHPLCAGVVALSNKNELNLKIAITAKLLHKDIQVICRADSHDVEANMGSFGTDHIIDPFDIFSLHLATAFQAPCLYLIQDWLSGLPGEDLGEPIYPPQDGPWVVCGYGRFGRAVYERLRDQGIDVVVIEAAPDKTRTPPPGYITGRGTEADTLLKAGIDRAVGLVSGTDDDVNNLSIIMTARELNPNLFVVARQNRRENQALFDAVQADMVMYPSSIVAEKIRVLLVTPMLAKFIGLALFKSDAWACELASRIVAIVDDHGPAVWEFELQPEYAAALCAAADSGSEVTLNTIILHPRDRERQLPCIPLLHISGDTRTILPDTGTVLKQGDKLLCCGRRSTESLMRWSLQNKNILTYLLTGEARAEGLLWRMWRRA